MSVQRVSSQKGGSFLVETAAYTFEVTKADRERTPITTTEKMREKMEASQGRTLPVMVHYHKDSDDNEYVITGPLPNRLPDPQAERRQAGER